MNYRVLVVLDLQPMHFEQIETYVRCSHEWLESSPYLARVAISVFVPCSTGEGPRKSATEEATHRFLTRGAGKQRGSYGGKATWTTTKEGGMQRCRWNAMWRNQGGSYGEKSRTERDVDGQRRKGGTQRCRQQGATQKCQMQKGHRPLPQPSECDPRRGDRARPPLQRVLQVARISRSNDRHSMLTVTYM